MQRLKNQTPAMFDPDQETLLDVPMSQPTTPKIKQWYVGCGETYETFQSDKEPERDDHDGKFGAVVGPFRTKRAAELMARFGRGNPHFTCVADAERYADWQKLGYFDDDLNQIKKQA